MKEMSIFPRAEQRRFSYDVLLYRLSPEIVLDIIHREAEEEFFRGCLLYRRGTFSNALSFPSRDIVEL